MFPVSYYPAPMFAPRYFPPSSAESITAPIQPIALHSRARAAALTTDERPQTLTIRSRPRALTAPEE